jgi:multisubunit Na+/H+ antiporter MnhB subunit
VKSFLLEQLARLIVPLSLLLGLALYLKGHDNPGGGFVAGLSFAVAGLLSVAAFGEDALQRWLYHLAPERIAVFGTLAILTSLVLPALFGHPLLTHLHGAIPLPGGAKLEWNTAMLFDAGVMMTVGGGFTAAGAWLWRSYSAARQATKAER